jgi:hypothetical protein
VARARSEPRILLAVAVSGASVEVALTTWAEEDCGDEMSSTPARIGDIPNKALLITVTPKGVPKFTSFERSRPPAKRLILIAQCRRTFNGSPFRAAT